MILSFHTLWTGKQCRPWTDFSWLELSDQGLHCLKHCLHLFEALLYFRVSKNLGDLRYYLLLLSMFCACQILHVHCRYRKLASIPITVISPVSAAALRGVALTRGRAAAAIAARGVYGPAAAAQLQAAAVRHPGALPTATAFPYAT